MESLSSKAVMQRLPENERWRAIGMLQNGSIQMNSARPFNVSQSVIRRTWNRHQQTGNVTDLPLSPFPDTTNLTEASCDSVNAKVISFWTSFKLSSSQHAAERVRSAIGLYLFFNPLPSPPASIACCPGRFTAIAWEPGLHDVSLILCNWSMFTCFCMLCVLVLLWIVKKWRRLREVVQQYYTTDSMM